MTHDKRALARGGRRLVPVPERLYTARLELRGRVNPALGCFLSSGSGRVGRLRPSEEML
jgi:hypothetical protein